MRATDYGSDDNDAAKSTLFGPTPGFGRVEPSPSKTKRAAACAIVVLATIGAVVGYHTATTGHVVESVEPALPQPQALTLASAQTTTWPTDNPVFASGNPIMIVCAKGPMCVNDNNAQKADQVTFTLWECNPKDKNQIFVYDAKTNALRNPSKNLCWDDDGQRNGGIRLKECSGNINTKFTYNWTDRAIRIPTKPGLCVDVDYFTQQACDPSKLSQQFEIVPMTFW